MWGDGELDQGLQPFPDADQAELVFELDSFAAADVARRVMDALHLRDIQVRLYGRRMTARSALNRISREGRTSFKLEADGAIVHFSTARAFRLQSLTICLRKPGSLSARPEIAGSLLSCEGFVQACVVNSDYSFWQNAADPLQYQVAGRSMAGLPMISNGLPAPLQKLVVDTSGNPGRRSLKGGYVEMVGHVMWFGPRFWALRGTFRRDNLLACSDFRTSEMRHGVLRMVAAETPFNDESSGPTQDRLRKLLFE
jgi:hypothetical protein